jgi:hypothetical protein
VHPEGSILQARHQLQTTGRCSFAPNRLKGSSREPERDWRGVPAYRVLGVSTGGAGISIGGPE